jgi:hypothetical protein
MSFSEVLILLSQPDLLQWPFKYVAENYGRIVYRRERRDAAGKNISLGSEVHNLPGTEAPSPGRSIAGAPSDAVHRVGETRGTEEDTKLSGPFQTPMNQMGYLHIRIGKGTSRICQTVALIVQKINKSLEM